MPTISFDPALLSAVHQHGPDIAPGALAERAGLSKTNIARTLANHRKAGLIKADALSLTTEGARLAGVLSDGPTAADHRTAPTPGDPNAVTGGTSAPLNTIRPSRLNPRKQFDEAALAELADSLLEKGQLQEIVVRPVSGAGQRATYEIAAGERRWRALSLLAKRGDISEDHPVRIQIRTLSDVELLELAVVENSQRADVHPLEEADAIAALQDARLKEGRAGDARAVCREIAEKLGHSERWAQIRVNLARRLSPAVRQAFAEGVFTSIKWADELGRWPHALQDAALEEIDEGEYSEIRTEADLKVWLRGEAIPVGKQGFEVQLYLDQGGTLSEPDEEGVTWFTNPGLAQTLAKKAAGEKAEAITAEQGYGQPPEAHYWVNAYRYPAVKELDPKPPKELRQVVYVLNTNTLELSMMHPVVERDRYEAWRDGEGTSEASTTETDAPPAEPQAQPLSRGQWLAGAKARTEALREVIGERPHLAMALALMAVLPGAGYAETMTRLTDRHPSGDPREIGKGHAARGYIALRGLPGFDDSGNITDRKQAMFGLIAHPDHTEKAFAYLIADLTIDCRYTTGPGAMPEALAIAEAHLAADPDGRSVDADWAKRYTRAQQADLIDAYGLFLDTDEVAALKKPEADKAIAEAFTTDHHPIEARFETTEAAQRLEARLIRGEKV